MANDFSWLATETHSGAIVLVPQCIPDNRAFASWVKVIVIGSGKKAKSRKYPMLWGTDAKRLGNNKPAKDFFVANETQYQEVVELLKNYFATKRQDDVRC